MGTTADQIVTLYILNTLQLCSFYLSKAGKVSQVKLTVKSAPASCCSISKVLNPGGALPRPTEGSAEVPVEGDAEALKEGG